MFVIDFTLRKYVGLHFELFFSLFSQSACFFQIYDEEFQRETEPKIQRTNMASTVLLLKSFGFDDPLSFDNLDRPSKTALLEGIRKLYLLQAIDSKGKITELGKKMAYFPLDPMFAKFLILCYEYGIENEGLIITAVQSVDNIFLYSDQRNIKHKVCFKF